MAHINIQKPRTVLLTSMTAVLGLFLLTGQAHAAQNKTVADYDTAGTAYDVTVVNDYAYVADGANGVVVLNVANPASPVYVTTYDTPGTARQLEASGDYLYVADTTSLIILNISVPTAPTLTATQVFASTNITGLSVDDPYVYVVGHDTLSSVYVVDITAPSLPVIKSTTFVTADGITVSGSYVYLVDSTTFTILNKYPLMTGAGSVTVSGGDMDSVQVIGSYAYVNDFLLGLDVINVTNPASPSVVAPTRYTQSGGFGGGTTTSNGYVFLTEFGGQLAVYDISQSAAPVFVDSFESPANGYDVTLANNFAFVASGAAGLHIIDVTKPDIVPPVITLVGNITIVLKPGQKFVDPGFSALDGVDGNLTGASITTSNNIDTSTVGEYYYRITVTDRAGNTTTIERKIIVAAQSTSIVVTKGAYTATFNGKKKTIRPLGTYSGKVLARKMIVKKYNQPIYVFLPLDPNTGPNLVVVDYKGVIIRRTALKTFSIKGFTADAVADGVNAYVAIGTIAPGVTARLYKMNATTTALMNTMTQSAKGTVFVKFLKLYSPTGNQYALVTAIKGKATSIRVYRYSKTAKKMVRDTTYKVKNIVLGTTGLSLKAGIALVP